MEPAMLPLSGVHNITAEGMEFTIAETIRASMVEMWLHAVKQRFLDAASIKCVGLDCEFTTPRDRLHQHAAVLQLSVASEVLVFQICQADHVPRLLRDFLGTAPLDYATRLLAMTCACCKHTEFKFRWCSTSK
jgi:hypothetical protein